MADPKGSRASVAVDTAGVQAKNTINVTMEDVAEEDRKEIEKELEEEMAEIRRKLACFQKMRNGVIKKADMTSVSTAKVTSNLSPKDLVHMVDVSIASKYGADLTQFTRVIPEDMCNTLDAFKQDLNGSLPRQERAVVQQINDESQGKRVQGTANVPGTSMATGNGNHKVMANVSRPGKGAARIHHNLSIKPWHMGHRCRQWGEARCSDLYPAFFSQGLLHLTCNT
jgi:hypothetical protein